MLMGMHICGGILTKLIDFAFFGVHVLPQLVCFTPDGQDWNNCTQIILFYM